MATKTRKLGTCPICFNTQVVKGAKGKESMVLHGYTRPGYGYIEGNCPGYHKVAFERSPEATKDFIVSLKNGLVELNNRLAEVQSPEFRETLFDKRHTGKYSGRHAIYENVPVEFGAARVFGRNNGHESWADLREKLVRELQYRIKMQEKGIADLTARVEAWKPAELVEESVEELNRPTVHMPAGVNKEKMDAYGSTECHWVSKYRSNYTHRTLAKTEAEVTCTRCLKAIAKAKADAEKKAAREAKEAARAAKLAAKAK